MPTVTLLTNLGAAKIAAAIAKNTTVPLASIAVGDGGGSAVTPVATQTALVNEVYRQTLNSLSQDPQFSNVMIAEIVVPASAGDWTAREIGLFDTTGVMIATGSLPDIVKTVGTGTLVLKLYLKVSSASAVSLTVDPSTVVATRSWILNLLYPVGEVLITHRNGSPATWLGVGTWERYGKGKMLAFYNDAEAEFNALDKEGGEKTHTLTLPEIPAHTHDYNRAPNRVGTGGANPIWANDETAQTGSAGGGQPHNNLPPYTTLFAWKRTA